jgi:serine/threonine protein kinase
MTLLRGTLLREGRYQIQELLARGGFGFIYLALDHQQSQQVVLKELLPALATDTQVQRRFVREGRTMQRLHHPHIARVEATFDEQGNDYMIVEYLSGGSLADRLERERRLPLGEAALITVSLCDALTYLHQRRIVHCDLNPSNVLFDAQGTPKLIDLGIAHVPDTFVHRSWHTEHDFSLGTVSYMAPEQLAGKRDDPRLDLYALAAMCYDMVSGRHYLRFDMAGTPLAQAENIQRVQSEMPESLARVPPEANEVLLRALAKDPEARYPSVATFRHALVQALVPHLPSEQGIRLVAPLPAIDEGDEVVGAREEWPTWVLAVLVAINATAILLLAWLILGAP